MIVLGRFDIKGRGVVVTVDDAPRSGLVTGVLVHQGDRAWRVRGIEKHCTAVYQPKVGLLLHREDVKRYGEPTVGESLDL